MEPISDPSAYTLIDWHELCHDYERVSEPQHAQDSTHEWPLSLAEREGVFYANAA